MVRVAKVDLKHRLALGIQMPTGIGRVNAGLQGAAHLKPVGPILKKAPAPDGALKEKDASETKKAE